MWRLLEPWIPFFLFLALAAWGGWMRKACKFELPKNPIWPVAEEPGLALELADSNRDIDAALGEASTNERVANAEAALKLQNFKFVLIPLYVVFFVAAALELGHGPWLWLLVGCAMLTGFFDVLESIQITRMIKAQSGSARRFGRLKWLLYFLTLGGEGLVVFQASYNKSVIGIAFAVLVIGIAIGGITSSAKCSFAGILSGVKLSLVGIAGLAVAPVVALPDQMWPAIAQYAFLLRVPLAMSILLMALPPIAFFTGARSLLRGLFDVTPTSLFVVALTALGVSGTACATAWIILVHGPERFKVPRIPSERMPEDWHWLMAMALIGLPVIGFSAWFSVYQQGELWRRKGKPLPQKEQVPLRGVVLCYGGATLAAVGVAFGIAMLLIAFGHPLARWIFESLPQARFESWLKTTGLFNGYADPSKEHDPLIDHIAALITFGCVLFLYASVGVYGWLRLGKSRTVPALASALMLLLMLGWMLTAVTFFFDEWRVPMLLIVGLAGLITAQSTQSDHFYELRQRRTQVAAPDAVETITKPGKERVIVVAANGGGIQASAWAAQVLYGLHLTCGDAFRSALRMTSSVSGGSVGNACFVNWLAKQQLARNPVEAACESSMDEVAWGLAWPDFLRGLLPWILRGLMGRGRALEKAWCMNSARDWSNAGGMDNPLSDWNQPVARGELPGVILNATVAETGERLLLATTRMHGKSLSNRARIDANTLHTINGEEHDVGVATAARLSASFPFVTPASRAKAPGPYPHVVDGGYYDNYGMATLVEWLDEALGGAGDMVKSVLVLQIHGAPIAANPREERHEKNRGWFYQAIAPLATLAAVRSSGQIAHNDIELELLQQKWAAAGIAIHSLTFEFKNRTTPLSWHLTAEEVAAISCAWRDEMSDCREKVKQFLSGSDALQCGCPTCKAADSVTGT